MDVRSDIDALPGFMVMGADGVARQGWEAAQRGDGVCIPGPLYRLIVGLLQMMPAALLRGLSRRSVLRPKR
jgi:short-subunit dehydrogenase